MISLGEGLGILDLIARLKKHTKSVNRREIIIYTDNKCVIKEYCNKVNKESDCAKEAGGIVEAIRKEVKSIECEVTLEYSSIKMHPCKDLANNLVLHS